MTPLKLIDAADLPVSFEVVHPVWIPMPDGTRLAGRLWRPTSIPEGGVPTILEFIPYRQSDGTVERDAVMHGYFAGHGYACLRVDLRGSGNSEGVLEDEYLQQELDDGVEILRWIAAQSWSDGKAGIIGKSWGGFNGLQIAALRPPELRAIITVCSTDDRYADDVHQMGGCVLGDNVSWASTMFAFNSCPPDPDAVGERWRDMWHRRLEGSGLWIEKWLRHQRRDAYWKHGSVCEDYQAIQCPVFAVSGWADGYSNAVFRLMQNLEVPRKGLVGPWSHHYPHQGQPGPAIGFLQDCLRWWDHWLRDKDTGVMDEPMLRVWMQDSVEPSSAYEVRPGRWVATDGWPSDTVAQHRCAMAPGSLVLPGQTEAGADIAKARDVSLQSPLSVGLFAGKWCAYASPPDLPHDQREEDGGSLVFETPPLDEALEILGAPTLELELSANRPVAQIAVRLSDVLPDDKATRITYGLLNLTHRDSHESPRPLVVDAPVHASVQMNEVAYRFPKGHRIRVSISTSYWPLAWPPPEPVRLTLRLGSCSLLLPVRKSSDEEAALTPFAPPEGASPPAVVPVTAAEVEWGVHRDLVRGISTLEVISDTGRRRFPDARNLEVQSRSEERYSYRYDDFDSARVETLWTRSFHRTGWNVRTVTRTVLTADAGHFRIRAELDAYEDDARVLSKSWDTRIRRDLV